MKLPSVHLVGAGVVGRAIAKAHIDAGISVTISDQDADALTKSVDSLELPPDRWIRCPLDIPTGWLPSISLNCRDDAISDTPPILIESISERLDVKQSFFALAEKRLGEAAMLCTNTSTLRIAAIAEKLTIPNRFCGMHFFMPVDQRGAVEVVRSETTSDSTVAHAISHVKRLFKEPLPVGDGPGFVVNRLLSPYLNEAMLLLGRGVSAEQIERAALAYGMPISPLELIDWIGARTMFEAGRIFWQSFPSRIDPSPILPALIKAKRFGRASGAGFYEYIQGVRSVGLSPNTLQLCEKYKREAVSLRDDEVTQVLAIPMWIEAAITLRDRIADSPQQFELAMHGGLGFDSHADWSDFFESLGSEKILRAISKWSSVTASMKAPHDLLELLENSSPSVALRSFANALQ